MKRERRKNGKRIHLVPLIPGIYAAILGMGLARVEIYGLQGGTVSIRLLGGLVIAGLGMLGIWDGIRDLLQSKEKTTPHAPADQYIFSNIEGKRSAHIRPEELQTQITAVAESENQKEISLQFLPPRPISDVERLEQVLCINGGSERPLFLVAVLQAENGTNSARLKDVTLPQAVDCLERLLTGSLEDFSSWQPAVFQWNHANNKIQNTQKLTIQGQERREVYRFFTGRDLELAIDGLEEGKYQWMSMASRFVVFYAFPSQEDNHITLRLTLSPNKNPRSFEKDGTATQVKFWLIQMISNGLPEQLYGWREVDVPEKQRKVEK